LGGGRVVSEILTGTTVLAAFFGGVVALFAPCCVSVMLPAYLATSFRRRGALVAMTFVFAAGVAAVILPIAFGASWITRLIQSQHTTVFLTAAGVMVALGIATLAGWKPRLPMLGRRPTTEHSVVSVFTLGAFSGVASACCAPVLAGVLTLAGAVASFGASLVVGVAYIFGMVLPLFLIALLWDRYDWSSSALFQGRTITVGIGRARRTTTLSALLSGGLLVGMGGLMAVIAVQGPSMNAKGWQARLAADLRHWADIAVSWLDALPGWAVVVVILAALGGLVRVGARQYLDRAEAAAAPESTEPSAPPQLTQLPAAPDPVPAATVGEPVGDTTS
jgi:cytochrome c biogenesis protein CcdA